VRNSVLTRFTRCFSLRVEF